MPFTSQLGSSNSQLGNIELGFGAGPSSNYEAENTLGISNDLMVAVIRGLEASSIYAPTNTAVKTQTYSGSNAITFGQTVGLVASKPTNNALAFSQSVDVERTYQSLTVHGYVYTHQVAMNFVSNKSASNVLNLNHSLNVVLAKHASNTLVYTQDVDVEKTYAPKGPLDLGHVLNYSGIYNRSPDNYFQYFQTLGLTKSLHISAGNTYGPSQILTQHIVEGASNALGLTQSVQVTRAKPAKSTLAWFGYAQIQVIRNIKVNHLLRLTPTLRRTLSQHYSVGNAFAPNQEHKKWKQFNLNVSNALVLSHEQVRELFKESVTSTLTLTQQATPLKVIFASASNQLALSQTLHKASTAVYSVGNTLIYPPSHIVYVPMGNLGNTVVPNLIVSVVKTYTTRGKRVHPYCVLEVPDRAITLPAAEFNDSQAYAGMFTIRRSMNGGTYTYTHRLNADKLRYDFQVSLQKSLELEDYLLNFNSRIHTLTNWKGEKWYVFITNNPMELIAKSRFSNGRGDAVDPREKVIVTLEFEGTRIN